MRVVALHSLKQQNGQRRILEQKWQLDMAKQLAVAYGSLQAQLAGVGLESACANGLAACTAHTCTCACTGDNSAVGCWQLTASMLSSQAVMQLTLTD